MKRNLFEQEYEDFASDLTNALAEHFCAWLVKDISEQNRIELSWANFNLLQDYCHVSDLANAKSHKAVLNFIEGPCPKFCVSDIFTNAHQRKKSWPQLVNQKKKCPSYQQSF